MQTALSLYRGHTASVGSLAWSPDGMSIASGGSDTTVQVWNATTGEPLLTYRGHTALIRPSAILVARWNTPRDSGTCRVS